VDPGFRIAVEREFDVGQVRRGVEPARELGIGQRVHERRGFRPVDVGLGDVPVPGVGERQQRHCRRGQRRVAEGARRSDGAHGPRQHRLAARTVEAVHRELNHERDRLRRGFVREALERIREARVCVLVTPQ
jgi:hypothetical protein